VVVLLGSAVRIPAMVRSLVNFIYVHSGEEDDIQYVC
jgi:hypothetical protein